MQYQNTPLNAIGLESLPSLFIRKRCKNALPQESGVYFVFRNGSLYYIGQAINIYRRLLFHNRCNEFYGHNGVAEIRWVVVGRPLLDKVEREAIARFKPPANRSPGQSDGVSDIAKMCRGLEKAGIVVERIPRLRRKRTGR